jgi:hypothetical protein
MIYNLPLVNNQVTHVKVHVTKHEQMRGVEFGSVEHYTMVEYLDAKPSAVEPGCHLGIGSEWANAILKLR